MNDHFLSIKFEFLACRSNNVSFASDGNGFENRCRVVPLVFSYDSSCNGGYSLESCAENQLLMENVYYYDWRAQTCYKVTFLLCKKIPVYAQNGHFR